MKFLAFRGVSCCYDVIDDVIILKMLPILTSRDCHGYLSLPACRLLTLHNPWQSVNLQRSAVSDLSVCTTRGEGESYELHPLQILFSNEIPANPFYEGQNCKIKNKQITQTQHSFLPRLKSYS